jgi:hypothetical protein
MAVWLPLLAIGSVRWDVAERYTIGALPFFLLALVACSTYVLESVRIDSKRVQLSKITSVGAVLLVVLIINPVAAWQAAKNDYRDHPDHKGAAEFIARLKLGPADIVIAEDCISQSYYLGKVEYRLQNVIAAKNHSVLKDGILYGQYSGARIIGSGAEFANVLDRESVADIYVISSAQVAEGTQRRNRGNGISEVLESDRLKVIFTGRDRETLVWQLRR